MESYRTEMETFFSGLTELSDGIGSIDAASESASSDLIADIDKMASLCDEVANCETPETYENIGVLAGEARDLLLLASEDFHKAFDGEYDESAYLEGVSNYEAANDKIRDIISLLRKAIE